MREAPEKGYSKKLVYTVGTCPEGLYLRLDGGKRYGKVCGLRFNDAILALFLRYLVQVHPDSGRSLCPLKEKD